MASAIFSGIGVTEMRGKIGNEVFFRNRGGAAVRSYAVPVQPNSFAQLTMRSNMASLIPIYKSLSEEQYHAWLNLSSRLLRRNGVGSRKKLSAFNTFISSNLNLMAVGFSPINTPSIYAPTYPINSIEFGNVSSGGSLELAMLFNDSTPILPSGYALRLLASPCVSRGIRTAKSFFLPIATLTGSWDTTGDYLAAYNAVYPAGLQPTTRLFIRAHVVNLVNGLSTPFITASVLVS